MEPFEYKTLFESETSYWWYRGLRSILMDVVRFAGRVLDAGCGTGMTLRVIQGGITPDAFGFDMSHHAARYWPQRGLKRVCLASLNEIPFRDASFDTVLCIDALESEGVREEQAYKELWRVTRPGGFIALVVPAYPWLFNQKHHRAVHACRRYTKTQLVSLLMKAPVKLTRITHLFPSLFPVIATHRLIQRFLNHDSEEPPRSDLHPLPHFLNEALFRIVDMERILLRRLDFPYGSSLLAVAQKADLS